MQLPQKLGVFMKDFQLWDFHNEDFYVPKFGLLTSRKMKQPNLRFFQTIFYRHDAYIIHLVLK